MEDDVLEQWQEFGRAQARGATAFSRAVEAMNAAAKETLEAERRRRPAPKVYISGPMTGKPDFNRDAFNEAEAKLREKGLDVFNPASICIPNAEWSDYMRRDIKAMMDCGVIVVLPEWFTSQGARIEVELALQLGVEVYELGYFLAKGGVNDH